MGKNIVVTIIYVITALEFASLLATSRDLSTDVLRLTSFLLQQVKVVLQLVQIYTFPDAGPHGIVLTVFKRAVTVLIVRATVDL